MQNDDGKKMWAGKIENNRSGFSKLLEKLHTVEKSNNQTVMGIFMNPTGNYHMPVKYFLENNGYDKTFMVDARRTEHMRSIMNLGKEKSDPEDAHILASVPWLDKTYKDKKGHERAPLSEVTRLRESINVNITRIKNILTADLAAVFPEFTSEFDLGTKTSLTILEKYAIPENIGRIPITVLTKVMRKSSRNHCTKEDAEHLINMARDSVGIPDKDSAFTIRIRTNVKRLREEMESLKDLDQEILNRSGKKDDVKHLTDMNGIGNTNAAAIVSEIGDIDQFGSALKLESYGGKCPDMTGSGGKSYAKKVTKIRNSHLSNAIYESAVSLVMHKNHEFYDLFKREIDKKKTNTEAYIVVGKRLLYHVFSIMKNGKPYKERIPKKDKRGRGSVPVE